METVFQTVEREQEQPLSTVITGTIPKWIQGSLYRNGPGRFEFGTDRFMHAFDGSALIHRFDIKDGRVTYQNRFLRTEAYQKNLAADRIVVSEFGTFRHPDPCKSLFRRFFSHFNPGGQLTDNTNVSVFPVGDKLFAATDGQFIHAFHPHTLETEEKVSYKKSFGAVIGTAHPHIDNDGTVHNYASVIDKGYHMAVVKIPPTVQGKEKSTVELTAEIVAKVKPKSSLNHSYIHSFAMTENYYIFVEQPLKVNALKMLTRNIRRATIKDAMIWDDNFKNIFHIIDKKTGKAVNDRVAYISRDPFMAMHHVNAYEENGHIVLDMCCYNDDGLLKGLYFHEMHLFWEKYGNSTLRRFVLPLHVDPSGNETSNLVSLPDCDAVAVLGKDVVTCHYELITDLIYVEIPQINYKRFNGRQYRYAYLLQQFKKIVKIDVITKTALTYDVGFPFMSEPVFVEHPEAKEEDEGVILTTGWIPNGSPATFLVILDAKNLTELGRASVDLKTPVTFHGYFMNGIVNHGNSS